MGKLKLVEGLTKKRTEEIIEAFSNKTSCAILAKKYKVSYNKILTILKINGIVKTTVDDTYLAKEYIVMSINNSGKDNFCEYYGVSKQELDFYLKREGVKKLPDGKYK